MAMLGIVQLTDATRKTPSISAVLWKSTVTCGVHVDLDTLCGFSLLCQLPSTLQLCGCFPSFNKTELLTICLSEQFFRAFKLGTLQIRIEWNPKDQSESHPFRSSWLVPVKQPTTLFFIQTKLDSTHPDAIVRNSNLTERPTEGQKSIAP